MEFRQLEQFKAVVEEGSVSKAARLLFCSQPMLSTQIQKLEFELGVELFDRSKRPMELTQAGQKFYKFCSTVLKQEHRLHEQLQDKQERVLSLGASAVPSVHIIPQVLTKLHKEYPRGRYIVKQADSIDLISMVSDKLLDCAIVGARMEMKSCHFYKLMDERLVLALPGRKSLDCFNLEKDIPKSKLKEIVLSKPLILREGGSGTREASLKIFEDLEIEMSELTIVAYMESQEAICKSICAGLGASILSEYVVKDYVKQGLMQALDLGPNSLRSFYLVVHEDNIKAEHIKHFVTALKVDD